MQLIVGYRIGVLGTEAGNSPRTVASTQPLSPVSGFIYIHFLVMKTKRKAVQISELLNIQILVSNIHSHMHACTHMHVHSLEEIMI